MPTPHLPDADFLAFQEALAGLYSLERELGRGGMGIVYLAREVRLDRLVAIKVLPPALSVRPELRERFLREARTAAKLSHPHVVPIFQVGEAGAHVYFAMAFIDGETLGDRVRTRGALPPAEVVRILREVAWALAYAHRSGIVHRDVKPDNILLERGSGRALVTDFGIAQLGAEERRPLESMALTIEGHVMGTAHFMSPEQAAGEPLDGRSDIYSLGVVGYLALSGQLPFDAKGMAAVLAKHLTQPVPPLLGLRPELPAKLAQTVERCLAKSPDARPATGEALAEALTLATEQRGELPAPIRVWLTKRDPLLPLYYGWSGLFGLSLLGTVGAMALGASVSGAGFGKLLTLVGFAAAPVVPFMAFRLHQLRRALGAGYTLDDLRGALTAHVAQRREELAFDLDRPPAAAARVLRVVTYVGLASLAAFTAVMAATPAFLPWAGAVNQNVTAFVFGSLAIVILALLGLSYPGRRIAAGRTGELQQRVWNGRGGRWLARAASFRLPRTSAHPSALVHRPTEMVLGLAAGQLFEALPRSVRQQLSEVPAVITGLESHARELRVRVAALDELLARDGATAAGQPTTGQPATGVTGAVWLARDAAGARLAQAVAALESVRLDLLRLQSGPPTRDALTGMLDAAHRVARDIALVADAQKEADRAAADGRLRASPAGAMLTR